MRPDQAVAPALRAMDKVEVDENGCWLFGGALTKGGYGRIQLTRTSTGLAHRVVWEWFLGPIPEGLQLDHLCRVRSCCNPGHLELVTARENLLRGETLAAENAAKTHCPKGHPYEPGKRECRPCQLLRYARYNAKRRAA